VNGGRVPVVGSLPISSRQQPPATGHRLLADFHCINYSYDGGVDGTLLAAESHSRGAALHDQYYFVDAGAYSIDRDDVAFFIRSVNANKASHKELAPVKALVLSRGDYSSDYASKNHGLSDA
jgi:hypothetical protein